MRVLAEYIWWQKPISERHRLFFIGYLDGRIPNDTVDYLEHVSRFTEGRGRDGSPAHC